MKKSDAWWLDTCLKCIRTGSKVICDPAPEGTDDDYLILIDDATFPGLNKKLLENGYKVGGSMTHNGREWDLDAFPTYEELKHKSSNVFRSYRKGEINLIVTASIEYFTNFEKATLLAITLNLQSKRHRIALFHSLCTDQWPNHDWIYIKD